MANSTFFVRNPSSSNVRAGHGGLAAVVRSTRITRRMRPLGRTDEALKQRRAVGGALGADLRLDRVPQILNEPSM